MMSTLVSFPSRYLHKRNPIQEWSEVDAGHRCVADCRVCYYEIVSTALSIFMRAASVYINLRLSYEYYKNGDCKYFALTSTCIVVPMCITTLIYANMCYRDGKFRGDACQTLQMLFFVGLSSFLFRYWNSLCYSIKCKRAERRGDKESQTKFFRLVVREESDVAFLRIFECFLEAAPQKILQLSIVLSHVDRITVLQVVAICSYFGSMAWSLAAYHRCNRYAQMDKDDVSMYGFVLQLGWHFFITVSRTLCIALVVSLFPFWTLLSCLGHALFFGITAFIMDRPQFTASAIFNFLFCLVLGVVYIFTYIAVKDGPTKLKYSLYYLLCSVENIACVLIFILYATSDMVSLAFVFYPLAITALASYYVGILFMILYYLYFHPKITARVTRK